MEASGLFGYVVVRRRQWEVSYDADAYVAVLDTYSWNRALAEPDRGRLYELIRTRIAARPGGMVRKTYVATLTVGRRL
jgi:hypothetical protein